MSSLAAVFSITSLQFSQSSSFNFLSYKFVPPNPFIPPSSYSNFPKQFRSPFSFFHLTHHTKRPNSKLFTVAQEVSGELPISGTQKPHKNRKLFISNFPWSTSDSELANLFAECGTVEEIKNMKLRNGKSRGFAFVTMASEDEAQAVVDKFNSFEFGGRLIKVEFAKLFKTPPPPPPAPSVEPPPNVPCHDIYVSNLAWKVRSGHLRVFFSESFKPLSSRVVFQSPDGRPAGYGFVSFATEAEANAAVSALDGKELMGRPLRLKISQKVVEELGENVKEGEIPKQQDGDKLTRQEISNEQSGYEAKVEGICDEQLQNNVKDEEIFEELTVNNVKDEGISEELLVNNVKDEEIS